MIRHQSPLSNVPGKYGNGAFPLSPRCRICRVVGTIISNMTPENEPTDLKHHAGRGALPHTEREAKRAVDWARCLVEQEGWLRGVILARTGEPQAVDEV